MRLIDADKLKEELSKALLLSADFMAQMAIQNIVSQAPTVNEWYYPSKGELPTDSGYYFVAVEPSFEGGEVFTTMNRYDLTTFRWIDWFGHTNRAVIAWMPLPEPPKERA